MRNSTYGPRFVSLTACLLLLASCAAPESKITAPSAAITSPIAPATPQKQSPKNTPGQSLVIVVKPGQSLGRIAERYHVPKRTIIEANQLQPPYELKAGSQLVIPRAAASTATVQPRNKAPTSGSTKTAHVTKVKAVPTGEPEVIPLD
jgi:LysM repeat protein